MNEEKVKCIDEINRLGSELDNIIGAKRWVMMEEMMKSCDQDYKSDLVNFLFNDLRATYLSYDFEIVFSKERIIKEELYKTSASKIKNALQSLSENISPEDKMDIYRYAVKNNGLIINYIPENFRTFELYETAFKQIEENFKIVPEELQGKKP